MMKRVMILLERIVLALKQLVNKANPCVPVTETSQSSPATEENVGDLQSDIYPPPVTETSQNSPATEENVRDLWSDRCPPPFSILESFLSSQGIRIKVRPAEDASDQVIDSLSLYLGEHYDALSGLHRKIKRAMQTGKSIIERLDDYPQRDVRTVHQFCKHLRRVDFLEKYRYLRSHNLIRAKTTTMPQAQRFFSGQWLERFILQKVKEIHAQVASEGIRKLELEYLINTEIILPNGDDFELDILAAIGSSIYWIEAKSGDYQHYVGKYSKFACQIGLDPEHSFLVLAQESDGRCDELSSRFSITVCNLRTFKEKLLSVVRYDIARRGAMGRRAITRSEC
jgi:hypothetical protein